MTLCHLYQLVLKDQSHIILIDMQSVHSIISNHTYLLLQGLPHSPCRSGTTLSSPCTVYLGDHAHVTTQHITRHAHTITTDAVEWLSNVWLLQSIWLMKSPNLVSKAQVVRLESTVRVYRASYMTVVLVTCVVNGMAIRRAINGTPLHTDHLSGGCHGHHYMSLTHREATLLSPRHHLPNTVTHLCTFWYKTPQEVSTVTTVGNT